MKILLVDDEPHFASGFATAVEYALPGTSVVWVSGVDDAVEKLKQDKFKLMILDVAMPSGEIFDDVETLGGRRTGVLFAQYVRTHFPELPVLVCSAHIAFQFDKEFYIKNGIVFLAKRPDLDIGDLVNSVRKALKIELETSRNLLDFLELKPGMFGVKVDVRKFIEFLKGKREKL